MNEKFEKHDLVMVIDAENEHYSVVCRVHEALGNQLRLSPGGSDESFVVKEKDVIEYDSEVAHDYE